MGAEMDTSDSSYLLTPEAPRSLPRQLGRFTLDAVETAFGLLKLGVITLTAFLRHASSPSTPLWAPLRSQIARSGVRLLTWATFLAAGLGIVVVGQVFGVVTLVGSNASFGAILASTVIYELGPIAMSILVLSVNGTATVIDLATARTTGQITFNDRQTRAAVEGIVIPKVLGFVFSIFCLTVYFVTLTLVFAYFVIFLQNVALSPTAFIHQITEALSVRSFVLIGMKSLCFGSIIGLVACYEALVRPIELEHLSSATIRAVVGSIVLCAIIDILFIGYLLL